MQIKLDWLHTRMGPQKENSKEPLLMYDTTKGKKAELSPTIFFQMKWRAARNKAKISPYLGSQIWRL